MKETLAKDEVQDKLVGLLTASETKKVIKPVEEDTRVKIMLKRMWAEFLGMTLFVFVGCAAAINTPQTSTLDVLKVSFAFGFGIFVLACTIGHHSGGQMNCAVTFCLVLTGDVSILQGILNTLAQTLGSILAGFLLWAVYPATMDKTGSLGSNMIGSGYEWYNAIVGEIMMTFMLCFVVLETAIQEQNQLQKYQVYCRACNRNGSVSGTYFVDCR